MVTTGKKLTTLERKTVGESTMNLGVSTVGLKAKVILSVC